MLLKSIREELFDAIVNEDVEAVRSLLALATEEDVNVKDEKGDTALMRVSSAGKARIVEILLSHPGIEVNTQAQNGETALMKACSCDSWRWDTQTATKRLRLDTDSAAVLELLLNHAGVNVNVQDKKGDTALMRACWKGESSVIFALLNHSPGVYLNVQNKKGDTALMRACWKGDASVVRALVGRAGTNVNLQNKGGETALMLACAGSHTEIIRVLLSGCPQHVDCNLTNQEGKSALDLTTQEEIRTLLRAYRAHAGSTIRNKDELCHAVKKEDVDTVRGLLALASTILDDVNVRDEEGNTPLILASAQGCTEIVEMLLAHRGTQINLQGKDGDTALMKACDWSEFKRCIVEGSGTRTVPIKTDGAQYPRIVEMLLARPDLDANVQNKDGETALIKASFRGHEPILAMLLRRPGIAINLQETRMGWTALMKAIFPKRAAVVQMLLAHPETDTNVRSQHGFTAFMYAAGGYSMEVTRILMNHPGVDLNATNNEGDTALVRALLHCGLVGDFMAKVLLAHPGIDVNKQGQDGRTALMKCCERQAITSVKTLLDHPDIDVTLRNQEGKSALDLVATRDQRIVDLLQDYISQLELPNEELVIEEGPVTTHTAPAPTEGPLLAQPPWPQPAARNAHGAFGAAPSLVPVLTEAERQALVDEMVDGFDFQGEVQGDDDEEDDVSEMGDTTIREADTVLVEGDINEMVIMGGGGRGGGGGVAHWQEENGRLQAEIYMLRNNFPLATTLHEQPIIGYAHTNNNNGNNPNNMDEGGDDESVQTSPLFPE